MISLLDTNVLSEARKAARAHPALVAWWRLARSDQLHLSVLTLGEMRLGVERLRPCDPSRAASLDQWIAGTVSDFGARVLRVDAAVCDAWGRIAAGRSVRVVDSLLAATALAHNLGLVTRNTRDVDGLGVPLLNPFEAG